MTLSLPTVFDEMRENRAANATFIVKLTDGTDTWYFSDQSLNLTGDGVQVEALVQSVSGLSYGFDPYTSQYQTASVDVIMANLPSARRDSTPVWKYTAERLNGIWGRALLIYLFPGARADAIADCLKVYTGTVSRVYTSGDNLVIESSEALDINHRVLPQRRITLDDFPDVAHDIVNRRAPIVWGTLEEGAYHQLTGFSVGELIGTNKWLLTDHEAGALGGSVWFEMPGVDSWGQVFNGITYDPSESIGGTFRGTLILDDDFEFYCHLYPFKGTSASTGTDGSNDVGPAAAWDHDVDTKFSVIANSTTTASVVFEWNQTGDSANDREDNTVARIGAANTTGNCGLQYYRSKPGGITISAYTIDVWDGNSWETFDSSTQIDALFYENFYSQLDWTSTSTGVHWHLGSGPNGGDSTPFKVRFTFTGSGWTANSTVVAYIHVARVRLRCDYPRPMSGPTVGRRRRRRGSGVPLGGDQFTPRVSRGGLVHTQDIILSGMGSEMVGREFGSWIDDGVRSNSLNEFGTIETAASVIESILRDELSLTNSDIDVDSFDSIYNSGDHDTLVVVRLSEERSINSRRLMDQLCLEDGLALYRRQNGEWRIMDVVGGTSTTLTIYPDDLGGVNPIIWKSDVALMINKVTAHYRVLPHDNQPVLTTTIDDSTSQSTYGIIEDEITFQYKMYASGLNDWAETMITSASASLLSRPHRFVRLNTVGIKWAHVELGDTFNLDASFDTTAGYCFGDSWNGLDLLVIHKENMANATVFDCLIWAE